ncbi:hypothetical protein DAPPUDRAFT_334656 [Daphnia pulex]|uniref:Uncharacterized protein n=1 Tax=Daphnia pulex TaxID=6669 RepID=E9HW45_DAPPU|nr:hypothetical protein DAPPUDRAFT_334656 [Daphnia pulex]|eukprot:EFX64037.1 hypothetical protein DAPPUDRAFT_334656 [Daphnia pulex]
MTQVLMSLPPSLKLNFGVAWDSTPAQEKTLRNLTTRLVKMEKNIKQSEEENSYNALMSMKETEKKVGAMGEQALPVRDNKRKRENEEKRKYWECGDESHVRARCRIFKRRLEKEREEDDRDSKRRRYERSPQNRGNHRHHDRNYDSRAAGARDTTTKIRETKTETAENIATQQCLQRMKTKIDQEDGMQIRGRRSI